LLVLGSDCRYTELEEPSEANRECAAVYGHQLAERSVTNELATKSGRIVIKSKTTTWAVPDIGLQVRARCRLDGQSDPTGPKT
jgi:hypothetical protein